ncbi:MAG: EamA family transporter [Chloroflexi bacterium]|nr:EamA family transporter [Chloroflexota bacterium]
MVEAREARRVGLALISLAALSWGTIGVAVGLLYQLVATNPFSVGFLRLLIAAPAMLLLSRIIVGPAFWRVQRPHLLIMGLIGAAFASYQLCYFAAIPRLGVAAAVMINICSAPIFTALLAGVALGERISRVTGLAMSGSIAGTALLVGGTPTAGGSALWVGTALALSAGLCYSLVVLGSRVVAPFYHPLQPMTLAFSLGAVLLLPPALATGLMWRYPPTGWMLLLYLALVPTALAYVLYLRGLRSVPATVAAILSLLEPLGSSVLAVLLLGERLTPLGVGGAALLLASMALLYLG